MTPRPAAATWIPAALFAVSLAGAATFHGRQTSSGRASLHAAATRFGEDLERRTQTALALREVTVEGDRGVATFVLDDGAYGRALRIAWRREGQGWSDPSPLRETEPVLPPPGPFRRR